MPVYRAAQYFYFMAPYPVADASALVRLAREDAGLTRAELARAAGTTQSVISAVEAGKRPVSTAMLDRLLRAARMRASLPLERYSDAIVRAARARHLDNVRAFGSVLRGEDDETSDVDLAGSSGDRGQHRLPVWPWIGLAGTLRTSELSQNGCAGGRRRSPDAGGRHSRTPTTRRSIWPHRP